MASSCLTQSASQSPSMFGAGPAVAAETSSKRRWRVWRSSIVASLASTFSSGARSRFSSSARLPPWRVARPPAPELAAALKRLWRSSSVSSRSSGCRSCERRSKSGAAPELTAEGLPKCCCSACRSSIEASRASGLLSRLRSCLGSCLGSCLSWRQPLKPSATRDLTSQADALLPSWNLRTSRTGRWSRSRPRPPDMDSESSHSSSSISIFAARLPRDRSWRWPWLCKCISLSAARRSCSESSSGSSSASSSREAICLCSFAMSKGCFCGLFRIVGPFSLRISFGESIRHSPALRARSSLISPN
mmetsp:Transcript_41153/g.118936  ORF Transcript_41153/g.118936 Transcript_41153/m.118936 type:complete len:304 (-) Transcript_41153:1028-1939(-)